MIVAEDATVALLAMPCAIQLNSSTLLTNLLIQLIAI
jgi:hypothetical protein